jgi:hypothetical protein
MKTQRYTIFKDSNNRISSEELLCLLCEIIDAVSNNDESYKIATDVA